MRGVAKKVVVEGWLIVALFAAWWLLSARSTSFFFPPLFQVFDAFGDTWLFERFGSDVLPSLVRLAVGYALAVVLGISVGVAIGLSRPLREGTSWLVEFSRSLPPVTLIPLAIVLFGIGSEAQVFVIVVGSIWPVLLNAIDGVAGLEPTLREVGQVYGLSRTERLRYVVLPAASPKILAGMRVSLSIAIILMVTSELVASTNGIGYFVLQAQRTFAIPEMWSGILLLGILGFVANAGFVAVERRVLFWYYARQSGPEAERSKASGSAKERDDQGNTRATVEKGGEA